jgi:hypothetical protein
MQRMPGSAGPFNSRAAHRGPSATKIDIIVTARTTAPSFTKIVNIQHKRKREQPAVVAALPTAAGPMDFKANCTRL